MNQLVESVEFCVLEILKSLNPLRFVSRELGVIKEFLMTCLVLEYAEALISCVIAIMFYGISPTIRAFINQKILEWSQLKNPKKPSVEVISMGQ